MIKFSPGWIFLSSLIVTCTISATAAHDAWGLGTHINTILELSGQPTFRYEILPGTDDHFSWRATPEWGGVDIWTGDSLSIQCTALKSVTADSTATLMDSTLTLRIGDPRIPYILNSVVERMRYGAWGEMMVYRYMMGNLIKGDDTDPRALLTVRVKVQEATDELKNRLK